MPSLLPPFASHPAQRTWPPTRPGPAFGPGSLEASPRSARPRPPTASSSPQATRALAWRTGRSPGGWSLRPSAASGRSSTCRRSTPTASERPSPQVDPDRLVLEVGVQALAAVLAPHAARLESAERRRGVARAPRVHPDVARSQQRGQLVRPRQVARPDPGRKAVLGVVRAARHLLDRVVRQRHQHRAEDLLASDLQVVARRAEQRRLDEPAVALAGGATGDELGALGLARLDVAEHS